MNELLPFKERDEQQFEALDAKLHGQQKHDEDQAGVHRRRLSILLSYRLVFQSEYQILVFRTSSQ